MEDGTLVLKSFRNGLPSTMTVEELRHSSQFQSMHVLETWDALCLPCCLRNAFEMAVTTGRLHCERVTRADFACLCKTMPRGSNNIYTTSDVRRVLRALTTIPEPNPGKLRHLEALLDQMLLFYTRLPIKYTTTKNLPQVLSRPLKMSIMGLTPACTIMKLVGHC